MRSDTLPGSETEIFVCLGLFSSQETRIFDFFKTKGNSKETCLFLETFVLDMKRGVNI